MSKINRLVNRIKIRNQILITMIIIAVTSTAIISGIVYTVSKKTIEDNYKNAHINNLEVSSKIIDIQLENIVDLGRTLLIDNTFMNILINDTKITDDIEFSGTQNQVALGKKLRNITSQDNMIEGISVVSESGSCYFSANRSDFNSHYYDYFRVNNILEEEWVQAARDALGKEVFYGYNVLWPEYEGGGVSFVKNLIKPGTNESMGFVIVNIQENLLAKAFGSKKEGFQTNRYMIVDADSKYPCIYLNSDESQRDEILEDYINNGTSGKYLFSKYVNSTTGWMTVNIIEQDELNRESAYIGRVTLLVCIGLIILSIYISKFISDRISKPLHTLEKAIIKVGEGDRHITEYFDDSEIGEIGNNFKEMVNNNLELRERLLASQLNEREAQLLLLQAKIYPHFLYNTLDSLYCMAIINNEDDIATMVLALSNTFKLSLNQGDKFITVRDEIQRMREYMTIHNMRYKDRFAFIVEVEEQIESMKIITFILQPFIENAVYHGLEPKIGKGYIKVIGKQAENTLHFTIEDNGVGIEDLSVIETGYGVRNVRERISLFYGEGYGVTFISKRNEGTKVFIAIPVGREGGNIHAHNGNN